jgi:hypothetical protein
MTVIAPCNPHRSSGDDSASPEVESARMRRSPPSEHRSLALRLRITAVAATALLSSCTLLAPQDQRDRMELEHAWRNWQARGSLNYSYVQKRLCYCSAAFLEPVRVTVQDGVVTGRTYLGTNTQVALQHAATWGTIIDLFEMIENAIAEDVSSLLVSYHPTLGFPTHISIDFRDAAVDDEIAITATSLNLDGG